jgi:TonB family protein
VIALITVAVIAVQGTGCGETKYPPELPAPGALVDSAHAMDDLGAFADPAKPMVFSVVFNSGDSIGRVRALDKNDAAAAVSLANYVRRQQPQELWAIRVRIAGGDKPALTLERSQYCPPVSRSSESRRADITGAVATVTTGNAPPLSVPPIPPRAGSSIDEVSVEALISIEGHVVVARVVKSSGNPDTDARAVTEMKQRKFEPAKLDGLLIQAVYRPNGESPRP